MTYATIEDGESTPLQDGGYSANGTTSGSSSTNQRGSFATVRAVMVGATVMGALVLLRMAGPSTMMRTKSSSSTVDSMVVVSSAATQKNDPCLVAGGNFNWNNNDRDGQIPSKLAINGKTRPNTAGPNRTTAAMMMMIRWVDILYVSPSRSTSRFSPVLVMAGIPIRPTICIQSIIAGHRVPP